MSFNPFSYFFPEKKSSKSEIKRPKGWKAVPPPENSERRRLMEGNDLQTSGGCRAIHHVTAR